jgi:hypothetical protein
MGSRPFIPHAGGDEVKMRRLPRWTLFPLILVTAGIAKQPESNWPHITLANDELQLEIAVPDQNSGYYRSSRFDWSGVIYQARWKGVPLFGEFQMPRDLTRPDHISGTAEEFDNTGPATFGSDGDEFLKIGVGILRKNAEDTYASNGIYEFVNRGEWEVTQGKDWVEFLHRAGPVRGVAYELTKRIVLGPQQGAFRIERTLTNVGTKELVTEHYGHNFFRIADDPIGRNYRVVLPENCPLERLGGTTSPLRVVRGACDFRRDLGPEEYAQFSILFTGAGNFRLTNTKAGLEVEVISSAPVKRFVLYATSRTLCPEVFTDIRLAPGERFRWSTQYLVKSQETKAN